MGRLFGTDGARGVANTELSCETAMAIGRAAAMVLAEAEHHKPKVVIGKDTRISSDMLEAALVAGFCSVGADVLLLGVLPTPAVAYLVKAYGADAGVMISASHNPCEYNGIKIFNSEGYKLSDALEEEIEAIVLDGAKTPPCPTGGDIGRVSSCKNAVDDYVRHLLSVTDVDLRGMRLAVDCANGSASATARKLFSALGADCVFLSDQPDGVNINENCGSTHIEQLADFVKKLKYFAGVAFDGDADRCLAVDENGKAVSGDEIMYMCAKHMHERGRLDNDTLVTTVMSNFGLYKALDEAGIKYEKTAVGDKYVWENMRANGHLIGGEQSGHIIFSKYATTGDGLITAIKVMQVMLDTKLPLSKLASPVTIYPQVLKNVIVDDKDGTMADPAVAASVAKVEGELGGTGRVLLRKSGTEPVLRVMAEAQTDERCEAAVDEIIDAMRASGHLIKVK